MSAGAKGGCAGAAAGGAGGDETGGPMGAIWASEPLLELLGPGKHGTTFGGTPLICAGALKALEIIERDGLAQNATELGTYLKKQIEKLITNYPSVLKEVRGMGLMIGVELAEDIAFFAESKRPASVQIVERLHNNGLLTIPAGANVFRLLPALNLTKEDVSRPCSYSPNRGCSEGFLRCWD